MSSSGPSSADPTFTLTYLLNSMPCTTFVSRIRLALDPATGHTSDEITALVDALNGLGFDRSIAQAERVVKADEAADESLNGKTSERHCVRCHKRYLERDNGIEACTISYRPAPFGSTAVTNTSRHTTETKEAKKTRGEVPLKSCEEEWCGRKLFGGSASTFTTPLFGQTLSASTSIPPTASLAAAPSLATSTPSAATNPATPLKDAKTQSINGAAPVPQTTAKLGTTVRT